MKSTKAQSRMEHTLEWSTEGSALCSGKLWSGAHSIQLVISPVLRGNPLNWKAKLYCMGHFEFIQLSGEFLKLVLVLVMLVLVLVEVLLVVLLLLLLFATIVCLQILKHCWLVLCHRVGKD